MARGFDNIYQAKRNLLTSLPSTSLSQTEGLRAWPIPDPWEERGPGESGRPSVMWKGAGPRGTSEHPRGSDGSFLFGAVVPYGFESSTGLCAMAKREKEEGRNTKVRSGAEQGVTKHRGSSPGEAMNGTRLPVTLRVNKALSNRELTVL